MRRLAFIIAVMGMFFLALMLSLNPKEISKASEIEKLQENTRVVVFGKVLEEKTIYKNTKLIRLENNLEIVCECFGNYKDNFIRVIGKIENYQEKKQIRATEVSIIK